MPSVLVYFATWVTALVVWGFCTNRFRAALRRHGVKLMDIWERAGSLTEPGAVIRDEATVLNQLTQRQPIAAIERWRRATIASMVVLFVLLVGPVVLSLFHR